MNQNKGQIKMGETIAILIIFFFLVVIGFSFYGTIQEISFKRQQTMNMDLQIIKLYQQASFMTEFQCTFKDISVDNCYDAYKLLAFERLINDQSLEGNTTRDYYFGIFGTTTVRIKEIYPRNKLFELFNHPQADATYTETVTLPISIYNVSNSEFAFGLMNITYYVKNEI